jgi:hypothetical protein
VDGGNVTLVLSDESVLPELNRYLVAKGADVYAIIPQRMSLEDMFIQILGTEGSL